MSFPFVGTGSADSGSLGIGGAAASGNPYAMVGTAALQGLGAALGGSLPPNVSRAQASNYINVAPVGVNIGEIVRPYNEGSLTNGGYGIPLASRFIDGLSGRQTVEALGGGSVTVSPLILAAGAGAVVLVLLAFKKR